MSTPFLSAEVFASRGWDTSLGEKYCNDSSYPGEGSQGYLRVTGASFPVRMQGTATRRSTARARRRLNMG